MSDDPFFSAFMAGNSAALEDSQEQIRRMDLWRAGEGDKPETVTYAYWRELAKKPTWLEESFKAGYREKWEREIELFKDRMFG